MLSNSSILLIGSGRLAKHLIYWNQLLDKPNQLLTWDRSQNEELLKKHLSHAELIWLAISDSAIIPFYETFLSTCNIDTVHFSGALHDPRIISAHPLMSFPNELLPNQVYKNIHFALTGASSLQEALPNFSNSASIIFSNEKPFYHSLCVLAGNFPQILWNEVDHEFKKLKIPDAAFELYIKQITENYLLLREKAITGPIARNDKITIEKNMQSLTKNEKLKQVYIAFAEEFSK